MVKVNRAGYDSPTFYFSLCRMWPRPIVQIPRPQVQTERHVEALYRFFTPWTFRKERPLDSDVPGKVSQSVSLLQN